MAPDPKPARRIRDKDLLLRMKIKHRECAICGTSWHLHIHHVVFRSHSGDDVEANCVALCAGHHQLIHRHHEVTWLSLRRYLEAERPDTLAYIERKVGSIEAFFRV